MEGHKDQGEKKKGRHYLSEMRKREVVICIYRREN